MTVIRKGRFSLILALILPLMLSCAPRPREASSELRAQDFVDSLGVCVHFRNSDAAHILKALEVLGVRRIRTDPPRLAGLGPLSPFETLARAGVRATYFVNGGLEQGTDPGQSEILAIKALEQRYPGSIEFVEGPNEVNNWPIRYAGRLDRKGHAWLGGRGAIEKFQTDLYARVHEDPVLSRVPVIDHTDVYPAAGKADLSNAHIYAGRAFIDQKAEWLAWLMRRATGARPLASTEWGYTTPTPPGPGGVTAKEQSERILTGWAELARLNFVRSFLYELHDDGSNPADPEDHYGLFRYDWSPKPAALALKALIRIAEDKGPEARRFTPSPFAVSAHGAKCLVLAKSDGSYLALLWRNAPRAPHSLTITLQAPRDAVRLDLTRANEIPLGRSGRFTLPYRSGLLVLRLRAP